MRITEYLVAIIGKFSKIKLIRETYEKTCDICGTTIKTKKIKFSNKKQLVLQVELSIDKLKQNVDNFMKSRLSWDIMLYSMLCEQD